MRVGASTRRAAENTAATDRSGTAQHRFDSPALILGIGAVLALGVVLRFVCASDLWADEVLSVNISRLSLGGILTALRHDGAPPLYYFLLHGWMRIFGTGTASVRALSGGIGVLTLWPMWYIGRRLDERRVRLGLARAGSRTVARAGYRNGTWTLRSRGRRPGFPRSILVRRDGKRGDRRRPDRRTHFEA